MTRIRYRSLVIYQYFGSLIGLYGGRGVRTPDLSLREIEESWVLCSEQGLFSVPGHGPSSKLVRSINPRGASDGYFGVPGVLFKTK